MLTSHTSTEVPTFIVKSTLAITVVSIFIVSPFGLYNLFTGSIAVGVFCMFMVSLCLINSILCYKNKYSVVFNLFIIAPLLTALISFAIYKMGVTASFWAYQGLLGLYFILPEKPARIFNIIYFTIISSTVWFTIEFELALRFIAVLLGTSFFAFFCMREIYKQNSLLIKQSITDTLTGVNNRFILQSSLEQTIHLTNRTQQPVSIFMIDLDHFKSINDTFGHDTGDRVLEKTGDFLRHFFRDSDMIFRLGGEEFMIIVNQCDHNQSEQLAQKLRVEFENLGLINNHDVTMSVGVSCHKNEFNWKDWMKHADQNLYQAKENGRNQVVI